MQKYAGIFNALNEMHTFYNFMMMIFSKVHVGDMLVALNDELLASLTHEECEFHSNKYFSM